MYTRTHMYQEIIIIIITYIVRNCVNLELIFPYCSKFIECYFFLYFLILFLMPTKYIVFLVLEFRVSASKT